MTQTRRFTPLAAIAAGLALAACGGGGGGSDAAQTERTEFEREGDFAKGSPDAPVTMVEYASVACGGCAAFHQNAMPAVQEYVDSGDVRFVFREMVTGQPQLAVAGFMLARCGADEGRYFDIIDVVFEQQRALFQAMGEGRATEQLLSIARSAGFTEEEFQTCLSDEAVLEEVREANDAAVNAGVRSTPTFIFNGVEIDMQRSPEEGAGMVYYAGGEPIRDEQGLIPAAPGYSGDSFERIIMYFKARAEGSGVSEG